MPSLGPPQTRLAEVLVAILFVVCSSILLAAAAKTTDGSTDIQIHKHTSGDLLKVSIALLHDNNFERFAATKPNLLVGFYDGAACFSTTSSSSGRSSAAERCDSWLKEYEDAVENLKRAQGLTFAIVNIESRRTQGEEEEELSAVDRSTTNFTLPAPFVSGAKIGSLWVPTPELKAGVPVLRLFHRGKLDTAIRLPCAGRLGASSGASASLWASGVGAMAEELIHTMSLLTRPPSIGLYSIKAVEGAIQSHRDNHTIAIAFYEDMHTSNSFYTTELGNHFKDTSGVLFFHVAGANERPGMKDRNKIAILDHFGIFDSLVIFHHQTEAERKFLGSERIQQIQSSSGSDSGGGISDSSPPPPVMAAATKLAHKMLRKLNSNFIIFKDKLVYSPKQQHLLSSQVGYFAKEGEGGGDSQGGDPVVSVAIKGTKLDGALGKFVTFHGVNPIGLLTRLNKPYYEARGTAGTVYFFLPVSTSKVVVNGGGGGGGRGSDGGDDDDAQDVGSIAIPQHRGGFNNKTCRQKKLEEVVEKLTRRDSRTAVGGGGGTYTLTPTESKAIVTMLIRVAKQPKFKSFSFLLVHPLEHPELFASFGFDVTTDVLPSSAEATPEVAGASSGSTVRKASGKSEKSLSVKPVLPPAARATHVIGATVKSRKGGWTKKYVYPEPYLAQSFLEAFLSNVQQGAVKGTGPLAVPFTLRSTLRSPPPAQLSTTIATPSTTPDPEVVVVETPSPSPPPSPCCSSSFIRSSTEEDVKLGLELLSTDDVGDGAMIILLTRLPLLTERGTYTRSGGEEEETLSSPVAFSNPTFQMAGDSFRQLLCEAAHPRTSFILWDAYHNDLPNILSEFLRPPTGEDTTATTNPKLNPSCVKLPCLYYLSLGVDGGTKRVQMYVPQARGSSDANGGGEWSLQAVTEFVEDAAAAAGIEQR